MDEFDYIIRLLGIVIRLLLFLCFKHNPSIEYQQRINKLQQQFLEIEKEYKESK